MSAEIGQWSLILAVLFAITQGTFPLLGAARGIPLWMTVGRAAGRAQFLFLAVAFGCLVQGFIVNDFSILYVASHSNSELPLYYRIAATWGAHEGSILLWALILSVWTVAVTLFCRSLTLPFQARVLGVMGLISTGILLFILLTSNPFDRLMPMPPDGNDLNPLLQDFGMTIHPPMLYMGYVGLSVAFSFAIAALLGGTLLSLWSRVRLRSSLLEGFQSQSLSAYGMTVAHCGIAVFLVGLVLSDRHSVEKVVRLAPGESAAIGAYDFIFKGIKTVDGPNFKAQEGLFEVRSEDRLITELKPQKRSYHVQRNTMTEAAIDPGVTRDLYVALGEPLDAGAWSVRLYYKPFIRWIWFGGLFMMMGGFLALLDRRYRRHKMDPMVPA